MAVDETYSTLNYEKLGGATWEVGGALNVLSGGTATVESGGSLVVASGATLDLTAAINGAPGAGISGGTGTVFQSSVQRVGGIITTRFLLDLTGLDSSGTAGDIIGLSTGGVAYLGQITAARNGTIFAGTIRCLEIPTGGDPDVDFWAADEATGAFDAAISGLTGEAQLINTGDWTLEADTLTAFPTANQYIYATAGATDDATYTAGKFMIELLGYAA